MISKNFFRVESSLEDIQILRNEKEGSLLQFMYFSMKFLLSCFTKRKMWGGQKS